MGLVKIFFIPIPPKNWINSHSSFPKKRNGINNFILNPCLRASFDLHFIAFLTKMTSSKTSLQRWILEISLIRKRRHEILQKILSKTRLKRLSVLDREIRYFWWLFEITSFFRFENLRKVKITRKRVKTRKITQIGENC